MTEVQTSTSTPVKTDKDGVTRVDWVRRSPSLEWRYAWFRATRGADADALTDARDRAFGRKLELIDKQRATADHMAAFNPAGAGSPWYPVGPRNVNGRVKALAVHPTDANTVFAGAASGGVWKSTDGGQSWYPLWDMQQSIAIGALGIATSAPTIYAGTGEWTPGWGPSYGGAGVYVSADGGNTWTQRPAVLSRRIGTLVVDPTNPQRVLLCGDRGLEITTDGGTNWSNPRTDMVTDVVLDPVNAQTVYIAVANTGFYRSTDGGSTFTILAGSPTGATVGSFPRIAIGVSGAHTNNFLVIRMGDTVQQSIDAGTTFTAVPGSHGGFYGGWCDVIAVAPDNESILLWGGVGLDRTGNGGTTWTGLPVHSDQHAVVFAPSNLNVVYVANDGGVWRSDDQGATIRKVSNGLVITQFYNINVWKTLSTVLGGGAQDNATNYTTGGLTWKPVWTNDGGWFVIDPIDPHVMYAEGQGAYLAKTTDGGNTWNVVTAGITGSTPWEGVLTMDPNNHLVLYYGTNQVLCTTDACATAWASVSQVLVGEVSAIAVAPSDSNRVYVATGGGKLYSTNTGSTAATWTDQSAGLPWRPISSIWVDPGNRDHVVISLGGLHNGAGSVQSVWSSTNGGTTWTDISGDLVDTPANAVVVDPSSATTLYVATDTGVYRTTNGGTNWTPFDNGIPNVPVSDLVVDPALKHLYAGTMGRGAYKLDITPAVTKPQVDLYLRDSDLDTGEQVPSPENVPDPYSPSNAWWWMSPDIKVNHTPYFVPSGLFDGVDFDLTLQHQDPVRGQTNRFYLQVHNRGWQTTSNVSVRMFLCSAALGVPDLPNALVPPAFNLSNTTNWTPVGPAQTIATLEPNRPVIVSWDYALPMTAADHTCALAVVSSPDDPYNNPGVHIASLVPSEKRITQKNLHVVNPGPAPMRHIMLGFDLHNTIREAGNIDIVVVPNNFARGTIGVLLPKLHGKQEHVNVTPFELRDGERVGRWPATPTRSEDAEKLLDERLTKVDRKVLWHVKTTGISEIHGLRVEAGGVAHGVLVCSLKLDTPHPEPPTVTLLQRQNGKVVGGSTWQFGQAVPALVTRPPQRVRVSASKLQFSDARRESPPLLVARTTVNGDGRARVNDRIIGEVSPSTAPATLFDGYLRDGDQMHITLLDAHNPRSMVRLHEHEFTGPVSGIAGDHPNAGSAGDPLRVDYRVEAVDDDDPPAAD